MLAFAGRAVILTVITMKRFKIELSTEGNTDLLNITPQVADHLRDVPGEGVVHLFAVGSTAALTTLEFEPGLVRHDLKAMYQKLIPDDAEYEHEATWNDDNGHAHLRAALTGASLMVPFSNGRLVVGEYQQIVFIDFDTRPRRRTVIGTVLT
jgi:secondary thiamine-phosphate synthase enzyme